jgi:transposase
LALTGGNTGDVKIAPPMIEALPPARQFIADTAYDADHLRQALIARGTLPVIPNNPTRKRIQPFDKTIYKARNAIERMFCRIKDFRRIATRYDKLARNFLASLCIAAAIIFWLR